MKILVVGSPGSGKTTQAKNLAKKLDVQLIGSGELLRTLSQEESSLGRKIKLEIARGELVDDGIVAEIVKNEAKKAQYGRGFVMEGYPRSVHQLEMFNPGFEKVIYLKISPEVALERLLKRGRVDDQEAVIKHRMQVQHDKAEELIAYLKKLSEVIVIDGSQEMGEVFGQILKGLS